MKPPPEKRPRLEGATSAGAGAAGGAGGAESGGEYDSEGEVEATAEDNAFIDSDDDQKDVLDEYKKEGQDFGDEVDPLIRGRPGKKLPKRRLVIEEAEEDNGPEEGKKKKKKWELTDEQARRLVSDLFQEMSDAARADTRARAEARPAVHKLKMLEKVREVTAIGALENKLLEGLATGAQSLASTQVTLLHILRAWLRPSQTGELPALGVRECVYDVISRLGINPDHLKDSRLGEVLFALSHDPRETEDNRRKLKALIERFSRVIFQKSSKYSEGMTEMLARQAEVSGRGRASLPPSRGASGAGAGAGAGAGVDGLADADLGTLLGEEDISAVVGGDGSVRSRPIVEQVGRVARPATALVFDYTKRPAQQEGLAAIGASKSSSTNVQRQSIARKIQGLRKEANKGVERAVKMSIEGRGGF